jgi:hypothetical protein
MVLGEGGGGGDSSLRAQLIAYSKHRRSNTLQAMARHQVKGSSFVQVWVHCTCEAGEQATHEAGGPEYADGVCRIRAGQQGMVLLQPRHQARARVT